MNYKMTATEMQNAQLSIDILSDQIDDLETISVHNDDIFEVQITSLKQLVLDLRKQLL